MPAAIPNPRLPTLFGRATLVHDQHLALRRTFQRLREICADAGVRDPAGRVLARMIGELHRQMLDHFAAEEAGEYFGTIVADCPWQQATIARIRAEHRQMLRSLEKLAALGADPDRTTELGAAAIGARRLG